MITVKELREALEKASGDLYIYLRIEDENGDIRFADGVDMPEMYVKQGHATHIGDKNALEITFSMDELP